MYYTKNRGFENQWFLKGGFEVEIFLDADSFDIAQDKCAVKFSHRYLGHKFHRFLRHSSGQVTQIARRSIATKTSFFASKPRLSPI